MIIKTFDVFSLSIPFLHPQFYAKKSWKTLESLIIRLGDGQHFGFAEIPFNTAPDISLPALKISLQEQFSPKIIGACLEKEWDLYEKLEELTEQPFSFAAVEMAWWDLNARRKEIPLFQILGASRISQEIFTSVDRPAGNFDDINLHDFLKNVKHFWDTGYAHLELKIRPGWSHEMLNAVREMAPGTSFHLDAEASLRQKNLMEICHLMDFMPWMIEQPLEADNFIGHYDLQQNLQIPVGLDESISSLNAARTALHLKCAKCLKINPIRVGGFSAAKEIITSCQEENVDVWISSPIQTGIGASAALALACMDGVTGPFEYHDPVRYFAEENIKKLPWLPKPTLDEDDLLRITPSEEAGSGMEWNTETLFVPDSP
ncbi:MAG: enolase C-terminal domain-like protein [Planctomycetia bacterium]|nr:enolase C-terminal domain-like protein [Planctomycetia bacterium]